MIDGITFAALDKIEADAGSVLHFIKNDDPGYIGFGEIYFSTVKKGAIKAWKMHKLMTLNLVVPVGEVFFVFVDQRKKSKTNGEIYKVRLSSNPYRRMTVPPGIWFGFMGLSSELNLLSNQADIVHDPKEVEIKDLNAFQIDWSNL